MNNHYYNYIISEYEKHGMNYLNTMTNLCFSTKSSSEINYKYQVVQKLINWNFIFWSGTYYVFVIKRKSELDDHWDYYIKDHEKYDNICWETSPSFDNLKQFKTEHDATNFLNYHILKKTDHLNDEYVCLTVNN